MSRNLDLTGKTAVVFGVANEHSIAWSVAKALNDNGCRVALGYQQRNNESVQPLLAELNDPLALVCDFTADSLIGDFFKRVSETCDGIDILIHSAAFAKKEFLTGDFFNITRSGFDTAMEVSAYSLPAIVKYSEKLLKPEASVLTLSYIGSVKAIPNYNIMGLCKAALEAAVRYLSVDLGKRQIRVNAISAGPIATGAASGIDGFSEILENSRQKCPLKRNIAALDVANYALFLCSNLARNVTGQIVYVDGGESIV